MWGGGKLPAPIQVILDALTEGVKNPVGAFDATAKGLEDVGLYLGTGLSDPMLWGRGFFDEESANQFRKAQSDLRENLPEWLLTEATDAGNQFTEDAFGGEGVGRIKDAFGLLEENTQESIGSYFDDPRVAHAGKALESMFIGMGRPRPRGKFDWDAAAQQIDPADPSALKLGRPKTTAEKYGKGQEGQIFPLNQAVAGADKAGNPDLAKKISDLGNIAENHLKKRQSEDGVRKPEGVIPEIVTMTQGYIQPLEVEGGIELFYETDESQGYLVPPKDWDITHNPEAQDAWDWYDNMVAQRRMMDRITDDEQFRPLKQKLLDASQAEVEGRFNWNDPVPDDMRDFIVSNLWDDGERSRPMSGGKPYPYKGSDIPVEDYYEALIDAYGAQGLGGNFLENRGANIDRARRRISDWENAAEQGLLNAQKFGKSTLGDIWQFPEEPEMFQIAPELKDFPVRMKELGDRTVGHFSPSEREIALNTKMSDRYNYGTETEETVPHEAQHLIANQFGMPRGANSAMFDPDNPAEFATGAISNNANMIFGKSSADALEYIDWLKDMRAPEYGGKTTRNEVADWLETPEGQAVDWKKAATSFEQVEALDTAKSLIEMGMSPETAARGMISRHIPAFQQYRDTWGEVSARTEEARLGMSREERAATPYNTMMKSKTQMRPELRHMFYGSPIDLSASAKPTDTPNMENTFFEDDPLKDLLWGEPIREALGQRSALFDERFDPRVREQAKISNMQTRFDQPRQKPDQVSLYDLEGKPIISTMSDRLAAQGNITGINDVDFSRPVPTYGGQGFPFRPESTGMAWASAENPVEQIIDMARDLKAQTGENPFFMPWTMSPSGGDFAKTTGEVMIQYAADNMSPDVKKELDKDIREYVTVGTVKDGVRTGHGKKIKGWKGVDDPESIKVWRETPADVRKELHVKVFDKYRNKGGLGLGEARVAIADRAQLMTPDARLNTIARIDPDKGMIMDSGHPAYPRGVAGEGIGQVKEDTSIFELLPQVLMERNIQDARNPSELDKRALMMKPYGGVLTEDILKGLK